MLDPIEQSKNGFRAAADRHALRRAAADARAEAAAARPRQGPDTPSLRDPGLARLATNRRYAEAAGWTECQVEHDTTTGRPRLVGLAPHAAQRTLVPDWTLSVAADARARRASGGTQR